MTPTDLLDSLDALAAKAAEPTPAVKSLWLNLSNVCERGTFKVSLDIDGAEKMLFLQNVEQDEGVVCYGFNLTQYLRAWQERAEEAISRLAELDDAATEHLWRAP